MVSDPEKILEDLRNNKVYNFDPKRSREVNFHLGCGFVQDFTDTMCMDAKRYVDKMCDNYSKLFPNSPIQKQYRQPLGTNDHPELDVTAFCNKDETEIFQSLIGSIQWALSIGRMDVQTAVTTISSFQEQPGVGHLERLKCMVGFLASFPDYKIHFCTNEPDFKDVPPIPEHD